MVWRAITTRPERDMEPQPGMAGVPALASRPVAAGGLVHRDDAVADQNSAISKDRGGLCWIGFKG